MKSTEFMGAGVSLHALFRPGSPTILFLHGLAGHGGEWKQVYELLDDSIGVIAPDQRGHGESWSGVDIEVDRSAYVSDAVLLIDRLVGGSVLVVGHSMGGLVVSVLAARRPDLVRHLVLIEAGFRPMTETDFKALEAWFDRWPARFADENTASSFFGHGKRSTPAWVDGLARTPHGLVRRFDPETMLRAMRALASTSRAAEWSEILVPTALIRATDSVITDDEIEEMVAARPDTQLVEIEDSGHDVHLDQPKQVADVLTDIVESTS
ncbi:MAG TPA: alpha/beta hydrolase [Acidimicrobiia bacterium]